MAVAKGYVTRARAEESLSMEQATEGDGENVRFFRDILVDEGWMTKDQVAEVDGLIEGGAAKTGKIEGYRILSKIGQGGMGTVYKARQEEDGKIIALKVLPRKMALRGDFVERFLREARAASRIKSEHIVRTLDVGFSGGYYYFAMEYVEGESVDTTLALDGPMDESAAVGIASQMAFALRDAERAGMVHCDIKPGNIIVTLDGVAKLADLGLARETTDNSMTQTGTTLGTPNYMSPEQAKAVRSLDVRSDIYSLGVTFYHMVTGAVPFHGDTSMLTMLKHLNEQPVAPITRRPGISKGCNDVILKMLAKDRNERYRNACELIVDLDLVIDGKLPQFAESTISAPGQVQEESRAAPTDASRFGDEIRKHSRVQWFKTAAFVFLVSIVVVALAITLWPENTTTTKTEKNARSVTGNTETHNTAAERAARAALRGAKKFAAENPGKLVDITKRFATVERDHKETSIGPKVRHLRIEAQAKLKAAVNGALKTCHDDADAHASQDRFTQAIAAYDEFPSSLRTKRAAAVIRQAKRALAARATIARSETEAERLLTAARQTRSDHQQTARTLWKLVRNHATTQFYATHSSEAEALLIKAETAQLSVDNIFAVKPAPAAGGTAELTYDFSDAAQAGDWPTTWKERSLGRWTVAQNEMMAESGLAHFKVPINGDFKIELLVRDLRAASVRLHMPSPDASPKTNGYTFTWQRTGNGAVSTVSHAGKKLGKEKRVARFRAIGGVKLTLEIKAGVLTARVGNRLLHRVRATGPESSGYLVFDRFTRNARLAHVTLRCKLDRAWLQEKFLDPIKKTVIERIHWATMPGVTLLEGSDASKWTLSAPAHWTFAEGQASAAAGANCEMITGKHGWRDYVFGAKLSPGSRAGTVQLLFRWAGGPAPASDARGYCAEFDAQANRVRLLKVTGKKTQTLRESNLTTLGVEWYDVAVEARGTRIRVLVGGREILSAEDATYGTGRACLASRGTGARFSHITAKVMP